jgi:hypothetical protein
MIASSGVSKGQVLGPVWPQLCDQRVLSRLHAVDHAWRVSPRLTR